MRSLADRFWSHVDKNGPVHPVLGTRCWLWTGSRNHNGYGRFRMRVDGVRMLALSHRVSWLLTYGRWPNPQACHRCDNPPCIRPAHLFEGAMQANQLDARSKGRMPLGEDRPGAKLTEDQVREIRSSSGTQTAKAKKYGVSRWLVGLVERGQIWKHVT
jgi:hypothetical protein